MPLPLFEQVDYRGREPGYLIIEGQILPVLRRNCGGGVLTLLVRSEGGSGHRMLDVERLLSPDDVAALRAGEVVSLSASSPRPSRARREPRQ